MARYRYLVFDADGTLFDYVAAEARALEQTFARFELPFDDEVRARYIAVNHRAWSDFEKGKITSQRLRVRRFEELITESGWDADPTAMSTEYLRHLGDAGILLPGAEATVERLAERFVLALATNGIADVQRTRLAASGIGSYFRAVVISDEIGIAKPDSRYFDVLFRRLGDPPKEETLIIGDSLTSDMAGGAGYGMDTCWYNPSGSANPTELRPTYEIADLDDIDGIVGTG